MRKKPLLLRGVLAFTIPPTAVTNPVGGDEGVLTLTLSISRTDIRTQVTQPPRINSNIDLISQISVAMVLQQFEFLGQEGGAGSLDA